MHFKLKKTHNKRQRVVQKMKANESDFRFQNETIKQCKSTLYSATSFWKYNVLIILKLHGITEHLQKQPEVFYKKRLLWTISQFSQENAWRPATLLKRDSNASFFSVIIAKFLRTPILKSICERLNKLVNISMKKKYVKCLRFIDIFSRF